jgi:hypothetical protein
MKVLTLTQGMSGKGIVKLASMLYTLYAVLPISKHRTRHRVVPNGRPTMPSKGPRQSRPHDEFIMLVETDVRQDVRGILP